MDNVRYEMNSKIIILYSMSVIILMLYSMFFFYTWEWDDRYVEVLFGLIGLLCLGKRLPQVAKWFSVIILLFVSITWNSNLNLLGIIVSLHLPFIFALTLDDLEKGFVLDLWTKVFGIIIAISLIGWLCVPFGVLSSEGQVNYGGNEDYNFISYYVCLQSISNWQDFTRYTSLFLEPGHVGMIAAFTVFANGFDLKNKYNVIILIGAIFTLSLAAYLLLIIGYFITITKEIKIRALLKYLIPSVFALFVTFQIGKNYNNGNNFLNEFIIERLTFDEEKGIEGNNRFHGSTDALFEKSISSGQIITGMPIDEFKNRLNTKDISGAGFKIFMLEKGVIGTFCIFMFYFLIYKRSNNKRMTLGMLILYMFAFLQRSYPFWYVWLFLYLFTTVAPNINNAKYLKQKQ